MLSFRKFIFERDTVHNRSDGKFLVNCSAGNTMIEKRHEWKVLPHKRGIIVFFLPTVPNMSAPPPVNTKSFCDKDLRSFRRRFRVTENRIGNESKVRDLYAEIGPVRWNDTL